MDLKKLIQKILIFTGKLLVFMGDLFVLLVKLIGVILFII